MLWIRRGSIQLYHYIVQFYYITLRAAEDLPRSTNGHTYIYIRISATNTKIPKLPKYYILENIQNKKANKFREYLSFFCQIVQSPQCSVKMLLIKFEGELFRNGTPSAPIIKAIARWCAWRGELDEWGTLCI